MKILALTPFPYGHSPQSGGERAAKANLVLLAEKHEISVLTFVHENFLDNHISAASEMASWAVNVQHVTLALSFKKKILSKILRVFGRPEVGSLYVSKDFITCLKTVQSEANFDVVLFQFPQMAQYINVISRSRTVLDVQDAFSVSFFRRYASTISVIPRFSRWLAWLEWVRYERRYYRAFNALFCLSEQDRYGLTVFSPGLSPMVIPPPVASIKTPINDFASRNNDNKKIAFFGSFSHLPNTEGLNWFLEQVFPSIASVVDNVSLIIAGANLNLSDFCFPSNANYVGFVDDLPKFLSDIDVVVVPLLSGGGVKIKTVEALAFGSAVVSTSIGAEGTGAVNKVHMLIENSASGFSDAVISVLRNDHLGSTLRLNGVKLANQNFSYAAISALLDEMISLDV